MKSRLKSAPRRIRGVSSLFGAEVSGRFPVSKAVTAFAICSILGAAVANEFVIARYASADGVVEVGAIATIRWFQAVLFVIGISMLLRLRAALPLLIIGLSLGNLSVFQRHVKAQAEADNVVSEDRLRELAAALSRERYVGYISDEASPTQDYYLTQYALAPTIVEPGITQDVIVGNFKRFDPNKVPASLVIVRDFGSGVVLFRKRPE